MNIIQLPDTFIFAVFGANSLAVRENGQLWAVLLALGIAADLDQTVLEESAAEGGPAAALLALFDHAFLVDGAAQAHVRDRIVPILNHHNLCTDFVVNLNAMVPVVIDFKRLL